ncbi:MAG TPA: hypothetical protein VN493_19405 [Thermoanaerobaculia bacterium]|nr:hypothetical protein [Thermoanaerobaculia bacterium]
MTIPHNDKQESVPTQPSEEGTGSPSEDPKPVEAEAKAATHVDKVEQQLIASHMNVYFSSAEAICETALEDLPEDLPSLPPGLYPFRDPRHDHLVSELEVRRILLLTSYQETAAYAAAHSLVTDEHFHRQQKRALFPTRMGKKERSDLDLVALARDEFLGKKPQIVLIEIERWCTLLDSALALGWGPAGKIRDGLENHSSYLILAVSEELLRDGAATERAKRCLPYYTVSHLRYLLTRDFADRAEELEKRLLAPLERGESPMDLHELHQRVARRLEEGVAAFEELLREIEQAASLPRSARKERFQPIRPEDVFREESEVHRAAAFVATYFPDLGQGDFDRMVLLLLGEKMHERVEERWSDRWLRSADRVFRDCHLQPVISGGGSWVVDFSEPYLRRELRAHLERHFSWYVRHQCQALQESGALFALDLSRAAVEGLVRLFVDRAIADPAGFGSVWLLNLVLSLRIQLKEKPPSDSLEESLAWLLERLAVEAHLRAHFHGRLALLIREMLDRETLRPTVREFFEFLIAARQHDALLNVILDLARRLRFAPHFDPLIWMRRLLDQGSEAVRTRTADRLVTLARESGPRIFEILSVLRSWLPEEGRPSDRFSASNRFALELPFAYCLTVARSLPPDRFGTWPTRHPLFSALPSDPVEARKEIGSFIGWLFDPRGVALEAADKTEAMRTAEVVRVGRVADLVEHWAWVLEGGSEHGSAEGCALFHVVVEEVGRRIGERERAWLQRSWQRRQEDYLRQAAVAPSSGSPGRALLVARRAKLDQLRMRFALPASHQG